MTAEINLTNVRMGGDTRCDSVHREGKRTWRCQLVEGHPGDHVSFSGHRAWTEGVGEDVT